MNDPTAALRMMRPSLDGLAEMPALPDGYALRAYQPGDEQAWAAVMNTGDMGVWTGDRAVAELTGVPWPQFDPDGLFVATTGGGIVGSACAWLTAPEEHETGTLHMVCIQPGHRGRGLGFPLCLAVLYRFRERGFRRVALSTNPPRLGAIKVYLQLGFRPAYKETTDAEIWRPVLRRLGWPHQANAIDETAIGARSDHG